MRTRRNSQVVDLQYTIFERHCSVAFSCNAYFYISLTFSNLDILRLRPPKTWTL